LHKDAGFNIIRNWTGETTQELFYELADEYGMLVWNDFWFTGDCTVEPNDFQLFTDNARDAVRRFRNHPSIAIWCPRNEGFSPPILNEMLTEMMAEEDPTRHYHGQSRYLNMKTSGPWSYFKDPSLYFTRNAEGFNTELGTYAIPTANTIRKFIAPEDQWPINDVWTYHDLHHTTQNFPDFMASVSRLGEPQSMEDFARQAQFVTYNAWRNIMEAWNSRMWNTTTGLLLWMSHPAWPSFIWQTYTYDYETPGSYFGIKKATQPLHVQRNLPDNDVVIVNVTQRDLKNARITATYYDFSGQARHIREGRFDAPANQLTSCFKLGFKPGRTFDATPDKRFTPAESVLSELFLVRLVLADNRGNILSINDYWETNAGDGSFLGFNHLPKADLRITSKRMRDNTIQVEVNNVSRNIAAGIKLNVVDNTTGEILLPAYFSDGYINLLGREKRTITLDFNGNEPNNYRIVTEYFNQ
jgi:hypothetical protein